MTDGPRPPPRRKFLGPRMKVSNPRVLNRKEIVKRQRYLPRYHVSPLIPTPVVLFYILSVLTPLLALLARMRGGRFQTL